MSAAHASGRGFALALAVCAAAGVITIGLALGGRDEARGEAGALPAAVTEEYGRRLVTETQALLGPDHPDPARRLSGSRLACTSCHLAAGTDPGTLALLTAAERYPRESGRDGGMRDLLDRINGCMERSMNGQALPRDSVELLAMAAYIEALGDRYAAMGAGQREADEQPAFQTPDRAASVEAGEEVFVERCAICHGGDGLGLRATADPADGYVFPPLWGADSFNDGAGMHRVLTAARFIKARMPLGEADLTDDEAYDVAAYINAQPRPAMANLDEDYPDLTTKPIDSPYGPYADPFPQAQHQFGPFAPIQAYYDALARGETPPEPD